LEVTAKIIASEGGDLRRLLAALESTELGRLPGTVRKLLETARVPPPAKKKGRRKGSQSAEYAKRMAPLLEKICELRACYPDAGKAWAIRHVADASGESCRALEYALKNHEKSKAATPRN
jgi:hypothetical protein